MTPSEPVKEEASVVQVVEYLRGKRHLEMPEYFLVVHDNVVAEDGTVYVLGYNVNHHPNGVPVDKLTLRRISMKTGEAKRALKKKVGGQR